MASACLHGQDALNPSGSLRLRKDWSKTRKAGRAGGAPAWRLAEKIGISAKASDSSRASHRPKGHHTAIVEDGAGVRWAPVEGSEVSNLTTNKSSTEQF
jgi:hypothetical protein